MPDDVPAVWRGKPHTFAKHRILVAYLKAWIPILSRQSAKVGRNQPVKYVDGFAGPGSYEQGADGSPILAIRVAIESGLKLPTPVEYIFIELDLERYELLCKEIRALDSAIRGSDTVLKVEAHQGDCKSVLPTLIQTGGGASFGPALFFLDQFGYTDVPMTFVKSLLDIPFCEVFFYINWSHLNRFFTDEGKAQGVTETLGTDEWKSFRTLPGEERAQKFIALLRRSLQEMAGAEFVLDFAMYGQHNVPDNWLVFCTKKLRGLEVMKKAMWSVDESGSFRFSDRENSGQMLLLSSFDDRWLADKLHAHYNGTETTAEQVRNFTLMDTPCVNFRPALQTLEEDDRIKVSGDYPNRRKKSFPPDRLAQIRIRFVDPPRKQTQTGLFDGNP